MAPDGLEPRRSFLLGQGLKTASLQSHWEVCVSKPRCILQVRVYVVSKTMLWVLLGLADSLEGWPGKFMSGKVTALFFVTLVGMCGEVKDVFSLCQCAEKPPRKSSVANFSQWILPTLSLAQKHGQFGNRIWKKNNCSAFQPQWDNGFIFTSSWKEQER